MKVDLVRIGNSRGLRIPQPLIKQCGFGNTVDLRVENDCLVIAPDRPPRAGWDAAFLAAKSTARDELLLDGLPANRFDTEEWDW